MGQIALLGTPLDGLSHTYSALDLFRYSSPGARQLTAGNTAYFSLDGGNTDLNNFNTLSGEDTGDWGRAAAETTLTMRPSAAGSPNWSAPTTCASWTRSAGTAARRGSTPRRW